MPLADAKAGSVRGGQVFKVTLPDGTPIDITNTTITGEITDLRTGQARAVVGALTPDPDQVNNRGDTHWAYDLADVVGATYLAEFTYEYPQGATPLVTFKALWYVED